MPWRHVLPALPFVAFVWTGCVASSDSAEDAQAPELRNDEEDISAFAHGPGGSDDVCLLRMPMQSDLPGVVIPVECNPVYIDHGDPPPEKLFRSDDVSLPEANATTHDLESR